MLSKKRVIIHPRDPRYLRLERLLWNRSAPLDVLLRAVVDPEWTFDVLWGRHDLPPEVCEAALASPEPAVRGALARVNTVPAEIKARLADGLTRTSGWNWSTARRATGSPRIRCRWPCSNGSRGTPVGPSA